VLKVHSRCDLACDYCYVYTQADQSWRGQPLRMSRATVVHTADRIAEHVRAHRLESVKLILHGGEPLLAGPDLIAHAVTSAREAVGAGVRVDVTVQTNGIGLDVAYLELFRKLNVQVGVSIDGDAIAQDRHRKHASGKGSYAQVSVALRRLSSEPYYPLFGGLLCTVDVRNDPVSTYEALLDFGPPLLDFLLPHGNWTAPPPDRLPGGAETPYADWLIAVFDRWYGAPSRETQVRFLGEIMRASLGAASGTEAIGLSPVAVVVVETDGSIQQSDTLKSTYAGAPVTGLHVARNTFDDALLMPSIVARQQGIAALSAQCRACRIMGVCGGGHYAHRYRSGSGFANPSVYCPDLLKLITHIQCAMQADIDSLRRGRT
jgi:uncharacterized protein